MIPKQLFIKSSGLSLPALVIRTPPDSPFPSVTRPSCLPPSRSVDLLEQIISQKAPLCVYVKKIETYFISAPHSPNTAARIFSGMDANIMRTTVSAEVMLSFSAHSCVIPTAPMQ